MNAHHITRWLGLCIAALALLAQPALAQPNPPLGPSDAHDGKTFRVLSFHDVRTQVRASFATNPDESAVDETTLAGLFGWLQAGGWQPVSLEQIVRARAGGVPLPRQAVLLSFDDGYASAYTKVFPLLRQFNYPAVVALVTRWMEVPAGGLVPYGSTPLPRERFMTWAQAREMARSGLVEFASHSHDLHRGVIGNPQGNLLPAATTHTWDATRQRYEDSAAWARRVEADLRQSRTLIERHTASPVRALAWPYGAWNQGAQQAAQRAGFSVGFTLEDGPNHAEVPLTRIRRAYATYDIDPPGYLALLRQSPDQPSTRGLQRALHVDLDYVYDANPVQQERNLSLLLDRVRAVGPRSVFLQAYADPDGDGVADALYFPNRVLPVRADLFNRVAWQLRTRARVQVYAWMPVLAFRLPAGHPLAARTVAALTTTPAAQAAAAARYHRLSPFDAGVRELIGSIYDDLGRHASFAGVLFHDDAMLSDDEDVSPTALAAYRDAGLPASNPGDIATLRADETLQPRWQALKTRALTDFTLALAARLRAWHPTLRTARNLYARPLLEPEAALWFAQDYEQSLAAYDYTAIMAMPYMEQVADPQRWLTALARRVAATPLGLERTVFELQARDWRTGKPVPDAELLNQWALLRRHGVRHLAYYPDDFHTGQPSLATARATVSVRETLSGDKEGLDTPPVLEPTP
jgi:biofilm PGA synthesis lipoprotein PgaB